MRSRQSASSHLPKPAARYLCAYLASILGDAGVDVVSMGTVLWKRGGLHLRHEQFLSMRAWCVK